jgi:hypothetical protein
MRVRICFGSLLDRSARCRVLQLVQGDFGSPFFARLWLPATVVTPSNSNSGDASASRSAIASSCPGSQSSKDRRRHQRPARLARRLGAFRQRYSTIQRTGHSRSIASTSPAAEATVGAPKREAAIAPAAQARRSASSLPRRSSSETTRAAVNASPAAVPSTASTFGAAARATFVPVFEKDCAPPRPTSPRRARAAARSTSSSKRFATTSSASTLNDRAGAALTQSQSAFARACVRSPCRESRADRKPNQTRNLPRLARSLRRSEPPRRAAPPRSLGSLLFRPESARRTTPSASPCPRKPLDPRDKIQVDRSDNRQLRRHPCARKPPSTQTRRAAAARAGLWPRGARGLGAP